MFSAGLSKALVDALTVVSRALPSYLPSIQERLLTGLTVILTSTSLTQAKTPSSARSHVPALLIPFVVQRFLCLIPSPELKPMDPAASVICCCWRCRRSGTFEFDRWEELLVFVRDVVVGYLDDERPRVRRQAALTCAEVVLKGVQGPEATSGQCRATTPPIPPKAEEKEEKRRDDDGVQGGKVVQRLVAGLEAKATRQRRAHLPSHRSVVATPPSQACKQPRRRGRSRRSVLPSATTLSLTSEGSSVTSLARFLSTPPPSTLDVASSSPSAYPSLITDILDRLLTVSDQRPRPDHPVDDSLVVPLGPAL